MSFPTMSRLLMRASLAVAVSIIVALPATAQDKAQAAADDRDEQWWKGHVAVPGSPLDIVVVFRPVKENDQYTAKISIPIQGAKNLDLVDVVLNESEITFTIKSVKAVFEAERDPGGKTATGHLKQHGMTFPLTMELITKEEAKNVGPERWQTPKPPFPYQQRDVTYKNPKDGTKLAGTLTIPEGEEPHPVVILITGSGPQDRDETIFGHKPFLVIADHLTRHGVAVLRVDDRGVGGSSGKTSESTTKDFANDVISGMRFLKKQLEIDARRIGLLGHSEGGIIAPLVASRSKHVACIVLLAGPGLPGHEILGMQTKALLRAVGVSEPNIKRELKAHGALLETAMSGADEEVIREKLGELLRIQLARGGSQPTAKQVAEAIEAHLPTFQNKWMLYFLRLDPRDALRKVKCPVLALGGSLDFQVPPEENLAEIEKALQAAGNEDVTTKELPGLNHMFQNATTGLIVEYGMIQQTIAPEVLDEITTWLRRRFELED
ncbi:MAG: alpha/beta fold hydrolase [Phycisphaerae bacterium]|nr:alpha/beta fold hydrolase [Phycisphaerae bacterium]